MLSMNLVYKYVALNSDIYLGYIIFCLKHIYIIKHYFWIFNSEWNLYFLCWEKNNCFKYSLVTIHSFCFNIIHSTVVQIIPIDRKCKIKITVKIHLQTTVTQYYIPPRNSVNWINVGNGGMSSNVSFLYSSLNNLYESLHHGFPSISNYSLPHFEKI